MTKTQRRKRKRRGARLAGSTIQRTDWAAQPLRMLEKKQEVENVVATRGRTWTCDCGFATVDEKVAVQHMQGHFRRKENYRVVITYQGDEGMTVEDVRGVAFDEAGEAKTVTLDDLKREAAGETAESEASRRSHYGTMVEILVMVHEDAAAKLNGFDPVAILAEALGRQPIPPIRVYRGARHNSKGDEFPHIRLTVDSEERYRRLQGIGKGRKVSKRSTILKLAEALSGLPDDKLDALMKALQ